MLSFARVGAFVSSFLGHWVFRNSLCLSVAVAGIECSSGYCRTRWFGHRRKGWYFDITNLRHIFKIWSRTSD